MPLPHLAEVRVTMFTDPIVVDRDEIPGLRAQGLLVDEQSQGTPAVTSSAPFAPSLQQRGADTPKETTQP